jgi:prevent-host-death family protein
VGDGFPRGEAGAAISARIRAENGLKLSTAMKPVILSEDVLPIGEFKSQPSRVFRKLRTTGRPVVITQNGRPAAVLITPEEFDLQMHERERFMTAVREGLADSAAGRVYESEEVERILDEEFGPLEP